MPYKYNGRLRKFVARAGTAYRVGRALYNTYKIGNSIRKYASGGKRRTKPYLRGGKVRSNRKLSQRARTFGTGGSFSKFYYGRNRLRGPMRSLYAKTNKMYLSFDGHLPLNSLSGSQSWTTVLNMFDKTDCLDMLGRCVLQPSTGVTGYTATPATVRACLESCSAEVTLTNQSTSNTRVVIWDIICRRDLPALTEYLKPESCFAAGLSDEDQGALVGETPLYYAFNPFAIDRFTQTYVVRKMTHLLLGQGQTHIHRIHYAPNRTMTATYAESLSTGIRGLTCFTMIQVFGTPADNEEETAVSTTYGHLNCVTKKTYRYGFIPNNMTAYDVSTGLTPITPDIINIGKGVPEPETFA